MPFKNKNLEKAIELLEATSTCLKLAPNRATGNNKYRLSYELKEAVDNFLKSLEK